MLRKIHRFEGFADILFLAVPIDFFFPINPRWVVHLTRFALSYGVFVGEVVGKYSSCDGVSDPIDKLAVLVVGDFSLIHEKGGY